MSRQSARGRQCSSSSAGSASYQGVSGATSPVYHLPQDPFTFKKPHYPEEHNYYNLQTQCCPKESIADTHSYQYLTERDDRKSFHNDNAFSDDSSFYDYQYKRPGYSEYEENFPIAHQYTKKPFQKESRYQSSRSSSNHHSHKEPEHIRSGLDRVYPETPLTRPIGDEFHRNSLPPRGERSGRTTPESIIGSTIVDGCGGHCVAFENVCSYVLQIFFVMGILIGTSLCIAGTVLRRTKSRDLQVLVYIGAMSAMVCTLLLVVQCRVRRSLRKRKRAVRQARAMTIPLNDMRQVQPLIHVDRAVVMQRPDADQQGIPWWRRDEIPNANRH